MIFLKPIDEDILTRIGESGMPIVTVEDAARRGGLGTAVIEWLSDHDYSNRVSRIGIPDQFVPQGTVDQLHHLAGMDSDAIYNAIKTIVK